MADVPGSRNLMGIKDPAVDALVEKIIYAKDREELVAATRALDRVLWYGDYLVPTWYTNNNRVAYWDKFGIAEKIPPYLSIATYWMMEHWWSKQAE